jgi:hypothetical protein
MQTLPLYRYPSEDYIVDSPEKPDVEYIERARLVADQGKGLTKDDINKFTIIDVDLDDVLNWREIDAPELYEDDLV